MNFSDQYKIVLEQGEAKKPFYELSESERKEIAHRLFREVAKLYEKFGLKPVIGDLPIEELGTSDKIQP